ncbi:MAG: hypothetical protein KJ755_13705 [Alphaproteobacteria bacterium]|nr:hypothetical protein [Alphaproteobacteria bacterium]
MSVNRFTVSGDLPDPRSVKDETRVWIGVDASLTGLEVPTGISFNTDRLSARTVQRLVKKPRSELLAAAIAEAPKGS